MRTLLTTGNLALGTAQLRFRSLIPAGIGNRLVISHKVANFSNPTSIPISLVLAGRGLDAHSTEKQAYHWPHSRLTVTVLILPPTGRCSFTSTGPMP